MQAILNNPYRILGLLVGASALQQNKHITRMPIYLDAGADIPSEFKDFSFLSLGQISLTVDMIMDASSKLSLNNDKILAALFWFYDGKTDLNTDIDAFNAIREGDQEQVTAIWSKLISKGNVTANNASAFFNLGTLYLSRFFDGHSQSKANIKQGIILKLKFLESDFFYEFTTLATDKNYKPTKKEVQQLFLNEIQTGIKKDGKLSAEDLLEIINSIDFSAKEDYLKEFIQKPIEQIENEIESAKARRKANKTNSINIGKALYVGTKENLKLVKTILGANNMRFVSLTDKVSDEILQCGIDYFLYYKDTTTDPSAASLDLFKKAKNLATGKIAKQRCQENTENLKEWIEDKPEREKHSKIEKQLDKIISLLKVFDDRSKTISNADALYRQCLPALIEIKSMLGNEDKLYLKLSTKVAIKIQSFIIEEVNSAQQDLEWKMITDREGTLRSLRATLLRAWSVSELLDTMDLEQDFKIQQYNPNKKVLKGLCTQLEVNKSRDKWPPSPEPGPNVEPFDFQENAWWILGLAGAILGGILGGSGFALFGGIMGASWGYQSRK